MRALFVSIILLAGGAAWAATPVQAPLGYNFAELRFVDADNNGDGLRLNGSYRFSGNWLAVGSLTRLDYGNSVDSTTIEAGVGADAGPEGRMKPMPRARRLTTRATTKKPPLPGGGATFPRLAHSELS